MSKPDLRAGLEADLKLVCEGRKTKDEVIYFSHKFPGWKNCLLLVGKTHRKIDTSFQVLEAQVTKYKGVFQGTMQSVARSDILMEPAKRW